MTLSMDTVVIAEDNLDISMMIKDYFEEVYNLTVETTDKVASILPLVKESKASVLIMDLELQDGDATAVLKDVAAIPGLIVVIFTGTYKGREENELLKNGAQVVMRKPQKPATIWQQVLNLRKIKGQLQEKEIRLKILAKDAGVVYDSMTGTITKEGKKITILNDDTRTFLNLLAETSLGSKNQLTDPTDAISVLPGWVEKKRIIARLFDCNEQDASGFHKLFQYRSNQAKKTLAEHIAPDGNQEMIEIKRVGRYDSYYRLNPDVFEVSEPDIEE